MHKLILSILIFTSFNSLSQGQELKWGDLMNCDCSKINIDRNQVIDCISFYELADSCLYFGEHFTTFPIIENLDSVLTCVQYPKSAEPFKISGIVYISFLIDKGGKVYCYKILSELGEAFIQETERVIGLLKFNQQKLSGKPIGYKYFVPIHFDFEKLNKNKKEKNTGTNNSR
jgi:hypothetical protein